MRDAVTLRAVLIAGGFTLLATLTQPSPAPAQGIMHMAQAPSDLKRFNVTVRRFDPAKGLASGTDFSLPVDSPDEEHAVSAATSNAVAFTPKMQDGTVLPVAFICVAVAIR